MPPLEQKIESFLRQPTPRKIDIDIRIRAILSGAGLLCLLPVALAGRKRLALWRNGVWAKASIQGLDRTLLGSPESGRIYDMRYSFYVGEAIQNAELTVSGSNLQKAETWMREDEPIDVLYDPELPYRTLLLQFQ